MDIGLLLEDFYNKVETMLTLSVGVVPLTVHLHALKQRTLLWSRGIIGPRHHNTDHQDSGNDQQLHFQQL